MKICRQCDIGKSDDRFKLKTICKSCEKENYKDRKDNNRNNRYKKIYNIDLEQYNRMLKDQDYRCFICLKHINELEKQLSVDHCHITGKVRSLLCNSCNIALGLLKEDPRIIRNLLIYSENHKRALDLLYERAIEIVKIETNKKINFVI